MEKWGRKNRKSGVYNKTERNKLMKNRMMFALIAMLTQLAICVRKSQEARRKSGNALDSASTTPEVRIK